jgi:hypothetical protein
VIVPVRSAIASVVVVAMASVVVVAIASVVVVPPAASVVVVVDVPPHAATTSVKTAMIATNAPLFVNIARPPCGVGFESRWMCPESGNYIVLKKNLGREVS